MRRFYIIEIFKIKNMTILYCCWSPSLVVDSEILNECQLTPRDQLATLAFCHVKHPIGR
jgi:hypothetical protein